MTTNDATDRADVVIRPPILWLLLVVVGIGLDYLVPLSFLPVGFPAVWTGIVIWLCGFALALLALMQFRRAGTDVDTHTPTDAIVDTGVFAWTRNPIYIGAHICLIGVAVAFDSLWILAMLVPFYLVIRYGVIAREEIYLQRKFGEPYLAYMARVRRWF